MPNAPFSKAVPGLSRRDPAVASIARAWRELTARPASAGKQTKPNRRTLIACSGGCDSSALALALAAVTRDLVIAHIVHDLRPRAQALADRDAAARLAAQLDLPLVSTEISIRALPGNTEANARTARYRALADLARANACPFIATAHHADDQLETLLMALMRGSGPRGLSGVARTRLLTSNRRPLRLIRPMLGTQDGRGRPLTREDCERLCRAAGWEWQEDATNLDRSLLRNALRAEVLPILRKLRPRAAAHAATAATTQRDLARLLQETARAKLSQLPVAAWPRAELRALSPTLLIAMLRTHILATTHSPRADTLGHRTLAPIIRAIRDSSTDPRTFTLTQARIRIEAHRIQIDPL